MRCETFRHGYARRSREAEPRTPRGCERARKARAAVKPTAGEPAELSRVRSKNSNKAIGSAFTLKEIVIRICGILSLRETPKSGHIHGAGTHLAHLPSHLGHRLFCGGCPSEAGREMPSVAGIRDSPRQPHGLDGSASDDHKLDGSRSQTAFLDHPPMATL